MNFFEIVLTLAISLGAVVWGVNIYNQKGTWFLAGWNTMSKEEKATYDVYLQAAQTELQEAV